MVRRHRWLLIGAGCAAALAALIITLYGSVLVVVLGTTPMKQVELSEWVDQEEPLDPAQKRALIKLIYASGTGSEVAAQAIAVLNAHIDEDEPSIVRHLVYITFTSEDPTRVHLALTGLKSVSPEHRQLSIATFKYCLSRFEPEQKNDALVIAAALQGLVRLGYQDAAPALSRYTNASNSYLAFIAKQELARCEENQKLTEPVARKP